MERETLLFILASAFFGVVVWAGAAVASNAKAIADGEGSERRAWRHLAAPVLAGLLVVAFFVGWSLQEPDPADEWPSWMMLLLAGVAVVAALRGSWRACLALRRARDGAAPIATVGLIRRRIVIQPHYAQAAGPGVLMAALAHEAAHVRARDPLRLWLGQLLADLQWPIPGTEKRLRAWLQALEIRRDDEALATGVPRKDLAEAIVLAARLAAPSTAGRRARATAGQGAPAAGDGTGIAKRVRRLLAPPIPPRAESASLARAPRAWRSWCACVLSVALPLGLGFAYGETLLSVLPGIGR